MRRNNIIVVISFLFLLSLSLICIKVFYIDKDNLEVSEILLDGSGSYEYPYLISSVDDLEYLRELIASESSLSGVWFELTNNIDFEGKEIEPMVDVHTMNSFDGGFNGNGYVISGFIIDKKDQECSFWGRVDGVIENLTLEGTIKGVVGAAFAQEGYGEIINCISTCTVEAEDYSSGVVNNWNGSLRNILFDGELIGANCCGIVNTGKAIGQYIYSNGYDVGNLSSLEGGGEYDSTAINEVTELLNENARMLFLSGGHYIDLKCFQVNDGIELSQQNVAFDGNGTENNPYVIGSSEDFCLLLRYLEMGLTFDGIYFWQTSDINLNGIEWNIQTENCASFLGIYDGNGCSICMPKSSTNNGLFKKFDGVLINCKFVSVNTENGYGFAEIVGESAMFINSYMEGNYLTDYLELMNKSGRVVNSYIQKINESSVDELNMGLESVVVQYGFHCGELYTWKDESDQYQFDKNYKNLYLEKDRTYFKGSGVEKNPYIINNIYDFVYLRESVYYNENYFRHWFIQTGDIDFSDVYYWRAIACEASENSFYGNYNGNGYKILNFDCRKGIDLRSKSLFGNVSGTIFNLNIVDYANGDYNGIIADYASSSAKIYNNIIQTIKATNSGTEVGIVNNNYGNLYNNILLHDENFYGARVTLNNYSNDKNDTCSKYNYVLLYSDFSRAIENEYNNNSIKTALELKLRISLFNELKYKDTTIDNAKSINMDSYLGLKYLMLYLKKSVLLTISALLTLIVSVYLVYHVINRLITKKYNYFQFIEIEIVVAIHLGFFIIIRKIRPELNPSIFSDTMVVLLAIVFTSIFIYFLKLYLSNRNSIRNNIMSLPRASYKNIILKMIVFATPVLIGMIHINTPIAYDADLYYGSFQQAIQNFQLSLTGFLDSFSIASKPMHGIAVLLSYGEILDKGTGKGIHIINILFLSLAQYFVYKIIKELFESLDDFIALFISLCYVFSGYVLAGATYINPDYYSLIFFTYFVWSIVFDHEIIGMYFAYLTVCSKPNMVISYIILCGGILFYEHRKNGIKAKNIFYYLLPITIYLILYLGPNALNRAGIPADSDNDLVITILSRILQYTCYGFIWIQESLFAVTAYKYIRFRKNIPILNKKNVIIISVWIACFSQLLITIIGGATLQLCPRYLTICVLKNTILTAWAIQSLNIDIRLKKIGILVFGGLLFIQLFKTIDPSIICTTDVKYDGLHYLNFPKKNQTGNDLTFYNYEYCNDARIADRMLTNMEANQISNMYSDSRTPYKMAIGSSYVYACYWDMEKNCRTYIPNENCVRLRCKNITKGLSVKDVYWLDRYVVLLRNNLNNQTKNYLANKKKIEIDGFTFYTY